jgi:predicted AlkP superfamily pyrophosphatase or phosphodiesterase
MPKKTIQALLLLTILLLFNISVVHASSQPKLILQITVDALRGDLPERFDALYGKDGWNYLLKKGLHYNNANYTHANTETIVGHASLATGTTPANHGMVGNVWFDREEGRLVYNVEDANYHLLSENADVDQKTEIDPTQRTARSDGRSPNNIITSTFSDELAVHYNGQSKIFGVSVKDRGAISMAGHSGKAFWFSKKNGQFVTSNYYYDKYPEWVTKWNAEKHAMQFAGKSWELTHPIEKYAFGQADDREYETDVAGFGKTFPHAYGEGDDKYFTTKLTLSPAGDDLTLSFAKTLIANEQIGKDDVPDYLSVSFSSTDYVGHVFGASSLESEDNQVRLDKTLKELFAYVDEQVGLDNTLIVLSADHGQPEVPGYLHLLGRKHANYFDVKGLDKDPVFKKLKQRFGIGQDLIKDFFQPYIYLDRELIKSKGLDQAEIEKAIATELMKIPGISLALSSTELQNNQVEDSPLTQSVLHNFNHKRSGDIYIVFTPDVFINDFDGLIVSSTHGSPWRYDTHVPVIFAGNGLKAAQISESITPYDIAPTLSAIVGAKYPSGAIGKPLGAVLPK